MKRTLVKEQDEKHRGYRPGIPANPPRSIQRPSQIDNCWSSCILKSKAVRGTLVARCFSCNHWCHHFKCHDKLAPRIPQARIKKQPQTHLSCSSGLVPAGHRLIQRKCFDWKDALGWLHMSDAWLWLHLFKTCCCKDLQDYEWFATACEELHHTSCWIYSPVAKQAHI